MENFINFLIELQNKILKPKSGATGAISGATGAKSRANTIGFGITLCLNSKNEKIKQKVETDVKAILKKCNNDPEKLIKFVEAKGTKVYRLKHAEKLFGAIGQETGFVPETSGLKALLINYIIERKVSFKTDAMFVLETGECDRFRFMRQFYKWYAMKLNLPGYDAKSQESFNSFLYNNTDAKIKAMSIDEILDIKDAIARDIESINFVMEFAKSTVDSKKASEKIIAGGAMV